MTRRPLWVGDLADLRRAAVQVPGFDPGASGLVVASLSGLADGLDLGPNALLWTADNVVDAFRPDHPASHPRAVSPPA